MSSEKRAPAPAAWAMARPDERMASPIDPPVIRTTAATSSSTTRMETPIEPMNPSSSVRR